MSKYRHSVQLVCAAPVLIQQYLAELEPYCEPEAIGHAHSASEVRRQTGQPDPFVILFDESAIESTANLSLESAVTVLSESAPVVVVAAPELQSELTLPIALGSVDFVARTGHFVPVAASLVERRIRLARYAMGVLPANPAAAWGDFGEILRHEVNNPLTGILGNAELLLARRESLPPADVARVKTIAELAVRLRDTVRRLSGSCSLRNE